MTRRGGGKSRLKYQVHRAVDESCEVITVTEVTTGAVHEAPRMDSLLDAHRRNTGVAAEDCVADSKSGTTENYLSCHDRGVKSHFVSLFKKNALGNRPSRWGPRFSREYEMIPARVVEGLIESIRAQHGQPSLSAIALRSRLGKGPCQDAFCSARMTAYLYDQCALQATQGIDEIKVFPEARWKGQKPLMWGTPLIQAELQEAVQCGVLGLEFEPGG